MPILGNFTRAKEGKQAVADHRHLKRQVYITEITTEVENDQRESAMKTHSGPWHVH
jgi:hypothetical protein